MTTWIDVMSVARALDARRREGRPLDGQDAERLVTLLLAFHERAVASTPSPAHDAERGSGGDAPKGRT
jgi:hypothetical protein